MSYHELRLSKTSLECVISALQFKYLNELECGNIEEAKVFGDLEAYFKSKLDDTFSVYE
jgi:hypothetical protein